LSQFLGHAGSSGNNQKTELILSDVLNKIL
jgi:hypothetical protein